MKTRSPAIDISIGLERSVATVSIAKSLAGGKGAESASAMREIKRDKKGRGEAFINSCGVAFWWSGYDSKHDDVVARASSYSPRFKRLALNRSSNEIP